LQKLFEVNAFVWEGKVIEQARLHYYLITVATLLSLLVPF
jgi:hypothetical protein